MIISLIFYIALIQISKLTELDTSMRIVRKNQNYTFGFCFL